MGQRETWQTLIGRICVLALLLPPALGWSDSYPCIDDEDCGKHHPSEESSCDCNVVSSQEGLEGWPPTLDSWKYHRFGSLCDVSDNPYGQYDRSPRCNSIKHCFCSGEGEDDSRMSCDQSKGEAANCYVPAECPFAQVDNSGNHYSNLACGSLANLTLLDPAEGSHYTSIPLANMSELDASLAKLFAASKSQCHCVGNTHAKAVDPFLFVGDEGAYCGQWQQQWGRQQPANWCFVPSDCSTAEASTDYEGLYYSYMECDTGRADPHWCELDLCCNAACECSSDLGHVESLQWPVDGVLPGQVPLFNCSYWVVGKEPILSVQAHPDETRMMLIGSVVGASMMITAMILMVIKMHREGTLVCVHKNYSVKPPPPPPATFVNIKRKDPLQQDWNDDMQNQWEKQEKRRKAMQKKRQEKQKANQLVRKSVKVSQTADGKNQMVC